MHVATLPPPRESDNERRSWSPSPQRGEGGVRGFGSFRIKLQRPNPLNLSFSPLGRRDAACTLRLRLIARSAAHPSDANAVLRNFWIVVSSAATR